MEPNERDRLFTRLAELKRQKVTLRADGGEGNYREERTLELECEAVGQELQNELNRCNIAAQEAGRLANEASAVANKSLAETHAELRTLLAGMAARDEAMRQTFADGFKLIAEALRAK